VALALCAGWAPSLAGAQAGPARVGWLTIGAQQELAGTRLDAFRRGFRELGHVEGKTVAIEARFGGYREDRLPGLARELIGSGVGVIVAADPSALRAARAATPTLPIVSRFSDDPVAAGLAASLAHPGGRVTGIYSLAEELSAKRLALLREALPRLSRVAVLMSAGNPSSTRWLDETREAASALGIRLQPFDVARADGFAAAFRAAAGARAEALLTLRNPLIVRHGPEIVRLAAAHRLPVIYDAGEFVEAGGLMSYGANLPDIYRRLAGYADKILKGAKPGDLPVEQPTTFELVVNRKTVKTLGLTLPPAFLARADRIIE
jgi:putative ABC transport system substrate-binding protein